MHQILYQKKRNENLLFQIFVLIDFDFFFSGIFHFVKDNYFRTSSSSSEDEYDSDDSAHKGENNTTAAAANTTNKTQPTGIPLVNTANATTAAAAAANTGSGPSTSSDGNK
jgi:hypothetical protein